MAAISNLLINDGVPVAHTFVPYQTSPPAWSDSQATLAAVLQPSIKLLSIKRDTKQGLMKFTLEVAVPVGEVVTGSNSSGYSAAPKVAFVLKGQLTAFLPLRSTSAQRKDLRSFISNAVGNPVISALFDNLELPY